MDRLWRSAAGHLAVPPTSSMHPPSRQYPHSAISDREEAHTQLERNKAHASYLDTLQDALLNAVRLQHEQAYSKPPADSAMIVVPPMIESSPPILASLPLVLPSAPMPAPFQAAPANPPTDTTDADASTHLLEVCTRKLSALQALAKVTGWTAELTRRKAVLLPLMTQLLESEDVPPVPAAAPAVSAAPAMEQPARLHGPLLLTGMSPSAMDTSEPASVAPYQLPMASHPPLPAPRCVVKPKLVKTVHSLLSLLTIR